MAADKHRARELFLHAVGKLPPEHWDAYVARVCGADSELHGYVAHLLEVHRQAGSFLEQPAAGVPRTGPLLAPPGAGLDTVPAEGPGMRIGPYPLQVWLALESAGLRTLFPRIDFEEPT
jgi:hypothetical protein